MLSHLPPLPALAFILGIGALAQWTAWRLRIPAILLLLLVGFAAGPITGILDIHEVFGELLHPIVSLAVGFVLFEGGLTLRFHELRGTGTIVRNLVSIGAIVTWLGTTAIGHWLIGIDLAIALLVGALLTLTGPTVVTPLVRHVRPQAPLGAILRWEGILIDPIGAMLAIVVFQAIAGGVDATAGSIALGVLRLAAAGCGIGLLAGWILARALERFLVPDMLHVPVTLGMVTAAFVGADSIEHEAGLFAVTVMGMLLANRQALDVDHIAEWKENLSTILLSVLFVSIAAHLRLEPLYELGFAAVLFALTLIILVRPLAILLSTIGSTLRWRDRAFLMAMAPRGIVVAAVSSQLALDLQQRGNPHANTVLALVFPTIVITVLVYGLAARPFGRAIGVSQGAPQGALIVGADIVGREIGTALRDQGFAVLLVDTNARSAANARTLGLPTFHGSVLSSRFAESADLTCLGHLLALLPSDEVNRLAQQELLPTFDRSNLFRVAPMGRGKSGEAVELGRVLFRADATADWLRERLHAGATIKATKLTEHFGPEEFVAHNHDRAVPLFVLGSDQTLRVVSAEAPPVLQTGQTVLSLALGCDLDNDDRQEPPAQQQAAQTRPGE
ncbi:MAG: sodium:proton antiporter [Planctomycetes bacterium]|nr:sodium:proton antiporter [Planctomycetota bacterium]